MTKRNNKSSKKIASTVTLDDSAIDQMQRDYALDAPMAPIVTDEIEETVLSDAELEAITELLETDELPSEPETFPAHEELPEIVFDEAAALAELHRIDYAPIAQNTWVGEDIEPETVHINDILRRAAEVFAREHPENVEPLDLTLDAIDEPQATDDTDAPPATTELDFMGQMIQLDPALVLTKAQHLAKVIDDRKAHEKAKNASNSSIQKTLDSARKALTLSATPARVLIAANVDEGFVTRKLHEGSLYNVYAIGKFADIVAALGDGVVRNAINNACMRSLFACRAAKVPFNMETAKACASNKVIIDAAVKKHLVRHTVSSSTAPTQASSTMQALVTLGIVTTSGTGRNPTYTLTDAPITKRLEEVLAKVA